MQDSEVKVSRYRFLPFPKHGQVSLNLTEEAGPAVAPLVRSSVAPVRQRACIPPSRSATVPAVRYAAACAHEYV